MTEYVTLIGADQVATAGRQMLNAAETMQQAALNLDGSLERATRAMDDWLSRFEEVLAEDRRHRRNEP